MILLSFLCCTTEKPQDSNDTQIEDTQAEDTSSIDTAQSDTADTAEEACHEVSAFVNWNTENIQLSFLLFDTSASYYFGLTQSSAIANRWTGEDCLYGYVSGEEQYLYCHPAQTGFSLQYGASYDDVTEGLTTHFSGPEFNQDITYIIQDRISGCCWTWGHDPSYYDELSCTLINTEPQE